MVCGWLLQHAYKLPHAVHHLNCPDVWCEPVKAPFTDPHNGSFQSPRHCGIMSSVSQFPCWGEQENKLFLLFHAEIIPGGWTGVYESTDCLRYKQFGHFPPPTHPYPHPPLWDYLNTGTINIQLGINRRPGTELLFPHSGLLLIHIMHGKGLRTETPWPEIVLSRVGPPLSSTFPTGHLSAAWELAVLVLKKHV